MSQLTQQALSGKLQVPVAHTSASMTVPLSASHAAQSSVLHVPVLARQHARVPLYVSHCDAPDMAARHNVSINTLHMPASSLVGGVVLCFVYIYMHTQTVIYCVRPH